MTDEIDGIVSSLEEEYDVLENDIPVPTNNDATPEDGEQPTEEEAALIIDSLFAEESKTEVEAQKAPLMTWAHILATAKGELGVHEYPAGSNKQKYGVWYGMNGQPWCAMFVSWCYRENLAIIRGKFASTAAKAQALHSKGLYHSGTAGLRAGDIIFYHFGSGPIKHTGICIGKLTDGRFVAIEGNTGSSNGGSVMTRYRAAYNIAGYFRPSYAITPVIVKPIVPPKPKPKPHKPPEIK